MRIVASTVQTRAHVMPDPNREPAMLRLSIALFALAALTLLLIAARLRFLVPLRRHARVRDVSWLRSPGR